MSCEVMTNILRLSHLVHYVAYTKSNIYTVYQNTVYLPYVTYSSLNLYFTCEKIDTE